MNNVRVIAVVLCVMCTVLAALASEWNALLGWLTASILGVADYE